MLVTKHESFSRKVTWAKCPLTVTEYVQSLICLLVLFIWGCNRLEKGRLYTRLPSVLISYNGLGLPRRRFDWNFRVDKHYRSVTWIETQRMVYEDINSVCSALFLLLCVRLGSYEAKEWRSQRTWQLWRLARYLVRAQTVSSSSYVFFSSLKIVISPAKTLL